MLRCVERVADPVDKGLVFDLGVLLPSDTLGVGAANRDDVFGGLSLNAGGPSGSRSLSSPWHKPLNHYREYTEKSLISQTNSFDTGYDFVYDINIRDEQKGTGRMKVLVACEFSGTVRDAFAAMGHDATSADLLPSEKPGKHYQGDVTKILADGWDLMIAHPPCTHLAVSGARWFKEKRQEQQDALEFVRTLLGAKIDRIALENPVSVISSRIRKPDQIIQPWMFGHGETKATCLWLKGLPKLTPTNVVAGRENRVWRMPPSENRWKERSRTFPGIAAAFAAQWGLD